MNPEENLCWFHGKISRERADEILSKEGSHDGMFLVRESNSSLGDYVLSVLHQNEVWHYQIRRHGEDAFFSIDQHIPIHGLDALIDFYRDNSHGLVTKLVALCKNEPPPHDSRLSGRTNLLHRATKTGNLLVVSELINCKSRNIDAKNQEGQTAVHLACQYGHEAILKALIEKSANVTSRDSNGDTPLHYVCKFKQPASMVRLLVDAKAILQARNPDSGWVPLHEAGRHGNLEAVKELLEVSGGAAMPRTARGEFPLDFAREHGHTEIVDYLSKFEPKVPTTHRSHWCHGTLGRNEAVTMLQDSALALTKQILEDQYNKRKLEEKRKKEGGEVVDEEVVTQPPDLSGIFLVRVSERNKGNFVLTLLNEDQVKHFVIEKWQHCLYIDEGPYMPTLEHLIQYYMTFPDGLPINLRYPVTPKPKPPVPVMSTMPRNKAKQSAAFSTNTARPSSDGHSPKQLLTSRSENLIKTNAENISPAARSISISNDKLMNVVGLGSPTSPPASDNKRTTPRKSPKKPLFDGLRSLGRKSKTVVTNQDDRRSTQIELPPISMTTNLTFSSEFKISPQKSEVAMDSIYKIPTNNTIVDIDFGEGGAASMEQQKEIYANTNNNNGREIVMEKNLGQLLKNDLNKSESLLDKDRNLEYFIESDKEIAERSILPANTAHNSNEPVYFVDAPTLPSKSPRKLPDLPLTTTKSIEVFYDDTQQAVTPDEEEEPIEEKAKNDNNNYKKRAASAEVCLTEEEVTEFETQATLRRRITHPNIKTKPNYFIPAADLDRIEILGEGEFGSVYRGIYRKTFNSCDQLTQLWDGNENEGVGVAIKTLHDAHCVANRKEFLREASVMIGLEHHCIVKLIGISKGPPLMMIQELVALGSMLDYLQINATKVNPNFELKLWASQIACGMQYLESQHFVHRDLAARNILLASRHQAKISDFGLSRALCVGDNYYQASQGGKWPIKWYAPESFNFGTFSHASDVWSFGVVLWEMFSLGLPPFGDQKGVDVIAQIEKGQRLPKPDLCPEETYDLMQNCWNYQPKNRPTFKYLMQRFAKDPDYQNIVLLVENNHIS